MADCESKTSQGCPPFAFFMRGWIAGLSLVLLAGMACAQPVDERWIDTGELGEFHIVLPEGASPELQLAAELFQRYWKRCAGYELGISTENGGKINVWLGRELATGGLLNQSDFEDLGDEGFLIRTFTPASRDAAVGAKKQFIIAGATDLATLYGVCDFFTRYFNVRWLAPGVVVAPRASFHFPVIDLRVEAVFPERRVSGVSFPGTPEDVAEFCHAHKLRYRPGEDPFAPAFAREDAARRMQEAGRFSSHPGCFALDGAQTERVPGQLCPGAPETRTEMLSVWTAAIAADPARDTWSLSPGDAAPCACLACTAATSAEGSPMGPWLIMVNDLATTLLAAHPDRALRFHVLATGPFRTPPKTVKPAPAVVVEISTAGLNLAAPLRDRKDAANQAFVADLRGWSRATKRLYVWHALVHPANPLVPLPNLLHLREDVQVFAQADLAGVSIEAGSPSGSGYQADGLLRLNLAARHLWEPDLPRQFEMPSLLRAIHGAAGPAVDAYLTALGAAAAAASPLKMERTLPWWRGAAPALAETWTAALAMTLPAPEREQLWGAALPVLAVVPGCGAPESFTENLAKAGLAGKAATLREHAAALCAAE